MSEWYEIFSSYSMPFRGCTYLYGSRSYSAGLWKSRCWTQGSIGIENEITAADIATADAVILTTDMPIKNVERFDNLKKVKIGVGPAIKQADAIVEKMISMLK